MEQLIESNQTLRQDLDRERAARLASEEELRASDQLGLGMVRMLVSFAIGWFFDGARDVMMRRASALSEASSVADESAEIVLLRDKLRDAEDRVASLTAIVNAHDRIDIDVHDVLADRAVEFVREGESLARTVERVTDEIAHLREANRLLDAKCTELRSKLQLRPDHELTMYVDDAGDLVTTEVTCGESVDLAIDGFFRVVRLVEIRRLHATIERLCEEVIDQEADARLGAAVRSRLASLDCRDLRHPRGHVCAQCASSLGYVAAAALREESER